MLEDKPIAVRDPFIPDDLSRVARDILNSVLAFIFNGKGKDGKRGSR